MQLSQKSIANIDAAIKEMAGKFMLDEEQTRVTDLHLQPRQESGELIIYDDDDEELARAAVPEWEGYADDDFNSSVETILRQELQQQQKAGLFDKVAIWKPYSMVMVDDDKETIVDLLLIDDDTIVLNEQLLKGLDKEMDDFLTHLLEE